jgi:hypothetical protein
MRDLRKRFRSSLGNAVLVAGVSLLAAWPAAAQMTMRMPDMRGVWNPTVGSGAAYEDNNKNGKNAMEISIVGKEDVDGKTGYWVEMVMTLDKGQTVISKSLMVIDGKTATFARMIVQPPGQGPMELPAMMMGRNQAPPHVDARDQAVNAGSEDVTTPAGTFTCDHYKAKDGSWDAWLSTKVTPWGLVKSTNGDTTMIVTRLITDAKDQITGTPTKFDPSQMMRQGMGGGPPPSR